MTLGNPSAEFLKEKHRGSRRPGRDGDDGGIGRPQSSGRVESGWKVRLSRELPGILEEAAGHS